MAPFMGLAAGRKAQTTTRANQQSSQLTDWDEAGKGRVNQLFQLTCAMSPGF